MPKIKITKQEIVEKSYQVFRTRGYHNTSMAIIAKECGIFKSGLYHYFSSKEELMNEVLLYVHELSKNGLFSYLRNQDLNMIERIDKFLEILKVVHLRQTGGCIFGNIILETASSNDNFTEVIQGYFNEYKQALTSLFELKFDKAESKQLAIDWLQELEGAIMFSRLYDDNKYAEKIHKKLYKIMA